MALRISIVVHEPGNKEARNRFGATLMEALHKFDSGAEISVDDGDLGLSSETLEAMAQSGERAKACILLLQDLFGMEEEEARATYNQLEDKRVNKQITAAFGYAAGNS